MDKQRFQALWTRCRTDHAAAGSDRVFAELVSRYSEPQRRYHTPVHINHCLGQFDAAASLMDNPDAVELAVWFHDVIYDVPTAGNERRSAEHFLEYMGDGPPEELNRTVYDLVIVTDHKRLPESNDEKLLIDIDLSSFGLPWDRMLSDSVDVRNEFPNVSDEKYYPAQLKFLQSLLDREHFCFTTFFRERHERSARDNIERYLQGLRERGVI